MKTVIQMAREAGFTPSRQEPLFIEMLERFAELVRADEREAACDIVDYELDSNGHAEPIKIAIRARGETK